MGGEASEDPALAEAEQIVVETVEAFHQQQEVRRIDPAMAALRRQVADTADAEVDRLRRDVDGRTAEQIGRASCREREEMAVGAESVKKKEGGGSTRMMRKREYDGM